jgi:hypothetical protein
VTGAQPLPGRPHTAAAVRYAARLIAAWLNGGCPPPPEGAEQSLTGPLLVLALMAWIRDITGGGPSMIPIHLDKRDAGHHLACLSLAMQAIEQPQAVCGWDADRLADAAKALTEIAANLARGTWGEEAGEAMNVALSRLAATFDPGMN